VDFKRGAFMACIYDLYLYHLKEPRVRGLYTKLRRDYWERNAAWRVGSRFKRE
jgi:hypothetical protein